jgi:uncharacterized membrane protein YkvA (DUF1232 family)
MAQPSTNLTAWQVFRLIWHLPNFAKLYWRLFRDPRVPLRAKVILIAAMLYVLDPFDFLPDFLFPFLGMLDDLAVVILAARWFISLCPPDVVQERVRELSQEQKV